MNLNFIILKFYTKIFCRKLLCHDRVFRQRDLVLQSFPFYPTCIKFNFEYLTLIISVPIFINEIPFTINIVFFCFAQNCGFDGTLKTVSAKCRFWFIQYKLMLFSINSPGFKIFLTFDKFSALHRISFRQNLL